MGGEDAEKIQGALYRIAELASAARDMQEFYRAIHEIVGELMYAENLFIALFDEERGRTNWPYFADARLDATMPDPNEWLPFERSRSLTGYVLRTGEPQHLSGERITELVERGEIELLGDLSEDWLGVPLKQEGRTVGALVVQSYTLEHRYTDEDRDLLAFVGQHVGAALSRARAIEETRQRNAELALINSVQSALAGELEMQAIYDVVGDKVREIFDTQGVIISILDETSGLLSFPYFSERGQRLEVGSRPPESGFMAHVIETREPVLIAKDVAAAADRYGSALLGDEMPKSILYVPLLTGRRANGVISLLNHDREHAFDEADQRLLETLASSLSVALENARLVHETRQRNAELALINGVQEALAGELDMQAIYDVLGDRIRDVFDAQATAIAIYDEVSGMLQFRYAEELGTRNELPAMAPFGFRKHVLETGKPLLINQDVEAEAERYGNRVIVGEMPKSVLFVPLAGSGKTSGVIDLQNIDREHAFTDSDVQLLDTLARTVSVALENARLVHETRQRNAELALINSVQEAIAGELDPQTIYDAVGHQIREIFDAQVVSIVALDQATGLMHFPYMIDRGERLEVEPQAPRGLGKHVLETREPLLLTVDVEGAHERYGDRVVAGEMPKTALFVPLVAGGKATGLISLQNVDREHAFGESDQQLLETLAGSLSVALENARLVHETRQRNAELALINSVQSALAGELDMQAIYDAVGEKIREIFDAQVVDIAILDEATGLLDFPYVIERGEHLGELKIPLIGFRKHVIETREPLVIRESDPGVFERYGNPRVLQGDPTKCGLFVPLIVGGRGTGVISLQNMDREDAFGEPEQRLLTTLAGSLGVALENARLVHETRQRNAELALINSVQEAIAGELEQQAIYDAVGERIREIFDAQVVDIGIYDAASQLIHFPYTIERGERFPDEPMELIGFRKHVMETREPLLIGENMLEAVETYGNPAFWVGEQAKSWLGVPLMAGGRPCGVLSLQNVDREHAFGKSDQQLLETLAGSLSVALENARLVHETRQRNAELALINSVQEAIAGELDQQAIYDAVGDRIRDVFDAQAVGISMLDDATGLLYDRYLIERGERWRGEPWTPGGFSKYVLETRQSLLVVENVKAAAAQYGSDVIEGSEEPKSVLFVPLVVAGKATGVISLQNVDREHAFAESDRQLLETLAGSLSVALENARLVDETRQRNAELALINSVQDAIAGELDQQAIYDAVGDKIQEVFDAQAVFISRLDGATGLVDFPYIIERGERLQADPGPPEGISKHVLDTGESLLFTDVDAATEKYGSTLLAGEWPKSSLFVPLVTGGKATGVISLQNVDRTHAFGDSDQQLLETLAGSLSVALENARLVDETRQRNAELALINSVQDAIAGELDSQAIYDAVGDKIQEVFDAQAVVISILDESTGLLHDPYVLEQGERFQVEPRLPGGFSKHVLETRETLLLVENLGVEAEKYGSSVDAGAGAKSVLFVPLVTGGKATGVISLQNIDREHAFEESDRQLLETLAGSLSVALENARLVHETRQRNAELALINGVQEAIAGELDQQAIYDAVGDKIKEVFDSQAAMIIMLDEASGQAVVPYAIERGERQQWEPMAPWGFLKNVLETRESLLINEDVLGEAERRGVELRIVGEPAKSLLIVPLVTGGRATGTISLQDVDREHAFGASDQQLLETLAGSLSVALENARLVHETRQRVAELATVDSVGRALSSQLDLDALIELVGEQVRETFDADIAYVALHERATDRIEFVYYYETGERRPEPPIAFGEGLTSQILRTREPLLLNRKEHYEGQATIGTPSLSYLGVPIVVGERSIGVISVQSVEEEGRFEEADVRLLGTIASNVGVAIQNARLFTEVERQRGYLESLVSITPAAVVVLDAEERVTEWNPAAADLFGYSAEEALGRPVDDLVFGETGREEGREVTEEALREGRSQRITRRRKRDGTMVDVELMLVPLTVDGERAGFLGVYHDVTELQRARQEAEAATQAKSAFLATMSHEIRTPMNAVIGMTDLLLGTELTPEQREFAEVVHSSGDALLHVIDDILDYSKIEAGKLDLEREPFNLRDCVEGALDIVAPRAWEKELELGCLIDEAAPVGIVGDEARLRQVLLNLLSNAVKFTERGEVVVLVDAEETGPDSYRLELAVRDTGIGIPADRMDQLFTSFSQVDASTTRRFGGTGLGLAISKRLVELMGGTIEVESEEGKGSTFGITLPAAAAEVPERISLDDGIHHLAGKRILIVDDNATNREIVTRHARSWEMEPVAVELPEAALELIEAGEPFDVAVLDMMMPGMDGLALAGEIRSRRSADELPLLLLTSLGRLPQAESGNVFSAQLSKPLKASQLYNTLLQLLTGAGQEEVEPVTDGKHARSALRILLAEDNAMNQKVALRLLEQLGYGADVAGNGREAIEALERQPYDVVLMDVQMPELDGLDATRQIAERWPAESRPHIIAMTANALPEDREACFAAGMDDYVAKPIRSAELVAALKRAKPLASGDGAGRVGSVSLADDALQNLRDLGGDEFLGEVVDAFLADAPELLATLRRSLEEQSNEELRRAAHTLKSNGATLGAAGFAELCRTLEQRAKSGELDGASQLVDRIEQEYGPLEEALSALRSEPVS